MEQTEEFALTRLLRRFNSWLRNCIAGVVARTFDVAKMVVVFVRDLIVRLVVDGFPWLFRLIWSIVKFLFGRKMFNLIRENLILVVLLPLFLASLAWPFAVYYCYPEATYWFWIGWAWLLGIGLVGAWIGFKKGLYSRWRDVIKNKRANRAAAGMGTSA